MEYICQICKKKYSSYQSHWNNVNKYHNPKQPESNHMVTQKSSKSNHLVAQQPVDLLTCKFCKKVFKYKQGRWRHDNKCESKNNKED